MPFLFQAPQESHYLQFSLDVSRKAVIICVAEAGQCRTSAGPVRVSLHLLHTLLEADSQLAITIAGLIISASQEHAPLVTHPSSPTCPSTRDHYNDFAHTHTCRCSVDEASAIGSSNLSPQAGLLQSRGEKGTFFTYFGNHETLNACISP